MASPRGACRTALEDGAIGGRAYAAVDGSPARAPGDGDAGTDLAVLDVAEPVPSDPWEQALATAQEEIRTLIADGEIAHDQITARWVAEWAAASIDH